MTHINLLQARFPDVVATKVATRTIHEEFSINLSAQKVIKQVFFALLLVNFFLVALDFAFNYSGFVHIGSIRRLFNMAREDSLAAWYSAVQLLFVAVAGWLVYARTREFGWGIIAFFFTYLAIDDGSGLHERVGTAAKTILKEQSLDSTFNFPSYTWQLVYGPFFGGMALFMLWYLLRELKDSDLKVLFLAALSCYGTAEFLDFIEGMNGAFTDLSFALGLSEAFVSHYSRIIEEFLENLGTTLFLVCFLSYFFKHTKRVNIKIAPN